MFKKWWFMLPLLAFIALVAGCSGDKQVTEPPVISDEEIGPVAQADCAWWNGLGQAGRNNKIVLESLYSVDQQIWDQNDRVTPAGHWDWYLAGTHSSHVPGDWDYSDRSNVPGWGGQCKPFVREILVRTSGGAATLPANNGYDYTQWYPYRNRQDGINSAQPGEVLQLYGYVWKANLNRWVLRLHTAIIISNFHDGRFEVVDSNYSDPMDEKIRKHVFNINQGDWGLVDAKFYVIDCY